MSEIAILTAAEADYLAECEDRIERGLQTFVEVGTALAMIRDNKLYRAEHRTFAAYCEARWGFSDRRARQIIDAAEIGTIVPVENEGQARELARVPEPERADVWAKANEATGGKPTAAAIRDAASRPDRPTPRGEADGQLDAPAGPGAVEADGVPAPEAAETAGEGQGRTTSPDASAEEPTSSSDRGTAAGAPTDHGSAGAPVIPDPVADVQAALDRFVPDTNPHREWRKRFLADVHALYRVMRFDVDDVAEKADSQCIEELGRAYELLDEYRTKVLNAIKASLPDNVTPMRRSS